MENASRAILIAGAVLIVLVVASVVVIFFNKGANSAEQVGKNTQEVYVQSHNAQFNIYEGENRKKAEIDKLVSVVNNNNRRDGAHIVTIAGTGIAYDATNNRYTFAGENFVGGIMQDYDVTLTYNGKGFIETINVN